MSELCSTEKCIDVVEARADIENLKGWQKSQNGSIKIANEKIDKLTYWIMGAAGTAALSFLGTIITLVVILARM